MTASQGVIGTAAGPRDAGTAFVMTYHAFGGELVDGAGTWAYVRGGMGGVTQALASCARDLKIDVRTDASEVVEILGVHVSELGRFPAIDQEAEGGGRDRRSIVPACESLNENRPAKVRVLQPVKVIHGLIVPLPLSHRYASLGERAAQARRAPGR